MEVNWAELMKSASWTQVTIAYPACTLHIGGHSIQTHICQVFFTLTIVLLALFPLPSKFHYNHLWEYQTTWPASWETYMQVRKQQLELDMEQQTGSK